MKDKQINFIYCIIYLRNVYLRLNLVYLSLNLIVR